MPMVTPADAHEIFSPLREHCIRLRRDYNTYTDLFNEASSELLSRTAPAFFTDVAEILQQHWVLQACKLSDPPASKRKDGIRYNITIQLLNQALSWGGMLSPEISSLGKEIIEYGKKLKPARDKYIAHFDYENQLRGFVLGETTEAELFKFIEDIQRYCDLVGEAIGDGPLDFSSSGCSGDALDLLKHLHIACEPNFSCKKL